MKENEAKKQEAAPTAEPQVEAKPATKVCKKCGQEKPLTEFPMGRWGKPLDTCKECRYKPGKGKGEKANRGEITKFTDEALIAELRVRGYKGTLIVNKPVTIDL